MSTNIRLTFDGEIETAVTGMERRLIRYRLVSLLNQPDEVRGVEIGVLDEGDEVVLLEKRGTYWRVLCPDGREGWLHKMTLGDVVIDSSVAGAGNVDRGRQRPDGRRVRGRAARLHGAPPAVRRELAGLRIDCARSPRPARLALGVLPQHDDVLVHDVGHERVRVAVGP